MSEHPSPKNEATPKINIIDVFLNHYLRNSIIGRKLLKENKTINTDFCYIAERNKSNVSQIIKSARTKHVGTFNKPKKSNNTLDIRIDIPIESEIKSIGITNENEQTINTVLRHIDKPNIPIECCETDWCPELERDLDLDGDFVEIIKSIGTTNEKSISNLKELILLNFEDDTFRPVIKINDKKIEIITKWYDTCKQTIDIEETNITIPNTLEETDISTILYKNINCSHKKLFIKSYVPEKLNNITLQKNISIMENQMSIKTNINNSPTISNKLLTLAELNISVPKNMLYYEDYFYKKDNNVVLCKKYKKTNEELKLDDTKIIKTDKLIDSEEICSAYNSEYNTLKPLFGSNAQILVDNNTNEPIKSNLIIVLLNPLFLQTIMLVDPDLLTLETIFECNEYGFTELFTYKCINDEIKSQIKIQYDGIIFNNVKEINNTLLSTSQFIEFVKNKNNSCESAIEEQTSVKKYLSKHFDISNDIAYKMKASVLYDILTTNSQICNIDKSKIAGFRNRLSNYLKEMGLQKKRYNNGYYYYGIVKKINMSMSILEKLKYEREELLENCIINDPHRGVDNNMSKFIPDDSNT